MLDLYLMCMDLKNSNSVLRQKSNNIILDIYKILNNPTDKTVKIVEGWKKEFKYVYGDVEANLSSNNKLDVEEILSRYGTQQSRHRCCSTQFKLISVCLLRQ